MSPLTRRQMLALGTAGAGAAAVGGAGLWWTSGGGGEALGGGRELVQPEVLSSRDGVLELALEAAPAQVRIGAREANVQAFNGSLCPGRPCGSGAGTRFGWRCATAWTPRRTCTRTACTSPRRTTGTTPS